MRNLLPLIALLLVTAGAACTYFERETDRLQLSNLDPDIIEMMESVSVDTIQATIETLAQFGTRHTLSDTESDTFGIGAARRWIKQGMDRYSRQSGGRLIVENHRFRQEPTHRIHEAVDIVNIVATLPGTDPADDRIFVVSGHYDSRASHVMDSESPAPGANDDASGTAAVMELARVMSDYDFRATLVFMAVAGEEQGGLGARQWAAEAASEGMNIAGMITNDIIGNHKAENGHLSDPNKVRLFASGIPVQERLDMETVRYLQTGGESDMPTRQLARTIKEVSESYLEDLDVWLIYRADRYLRGGGHLAFLEHGFPAVRFSEPHEDYRHQHQDVREADGIQYGDLPEFVDYDYVKRVTETNLSALANLARSPKPPANVGINVSELENDTRLRWSPSESENLAGYDVLWRETTSPVWQYKKFVGPKTHIRLKNISKDNWVFGVRSVSNGGHVGIPVFPMPFRE
ncbi:M28 family metallopeptidase [Rhodohalobacter sp. 8-1]|uniref:M28 family metallopeptidase n=1 Tax=Rhodohalobacter sp. 8-1 TaxID=3131972 RepID=UPI0030EE7AF7